MTNRKASSGHIFRKFMVVMVIILIIAVGFTGLNYYLKYYTPNVTDKQEYQRKLMQYKRQALTHLNFVGAVELAR